MNEKFEEYLDRLCAHKHISREDAMDKAIVKEVEKYYEEEDRFAINED